MASKQEQPLIRTDKAEKYMKLASFMANEFSKDTTKVGAVFLRPDTLTILSTGYNGMPRGIDEDKKKRWERPYKYFYVSHAEMNAITSACKHGTSLDGSIAVVTMFPCSGCAKAMIQSGVKMVVCPKPDLDDKRWGEEFRYSLEMLEEAGVIISTCT